MRPGRSWWWASMLVSLAASGHRSDVEAASDLLGTESSPLPFWTREGDRVPADLLGSLAEAAKFHRSLFERFACVEEIASKSRGVARFDYLLASGPLRSTSVLRFDDHEQPLADDGFPPAVAWSQIFDEANQTRFLYRHHGQQMVGFNRVHRISFRGDRPFQDGSDVREWEGLVAVDAQTMMIAEVLAVPRAYGDRLAFKREEHAKSARVSIGLLSSSACGSLFTPVKTMRSRKTPSVRSLWVAFGEVDLPAAAVVASPQGRSVAPVPTQMEVRLHRVYDDGQPVLAEQEERRYSGYRFFTVEAEAAIAEGAGAVAP